MQIFINMITSSYFHTPIILVIRFGVHQDTTADLETPDLELDLLSNSRDYQASSGIWYQSDSLLEKLKLQKVETRFQAFLQRVRTRFQAFHKIFNSKFQFTLFFLQNFKWITLTLSLECKSSFNKLTANLEPLTNSVTSMCSQLCKFLIFNIVHMEIGNQN